MPACVLLSAVHPCPRVSPPTGSKFGDLALHFLNRYGIMAVKIISKHELRRLCRTIGATALPRVTAPTSKEIGHIDEVVVDEVW